jgi:hypothetical protein
LVNIVIFTDWGKQGVTEHIELREKKEEILWNQKARTRWLRQGDRNSRFFHNSMINKRNINKITSMQSAQGDKLETYGEIEEEFKSYYHKFLSEPDIERQEATRSVLTHIPKLVTSDQNDSLM